MRPHSANQTKSFFVSWKLIVVAFVCLGLLLSAWVWRAPLTHIIWLRTSNPGQMSPDDPDFPLWVIPQAVREGKARAGPLLTDVQIESLAADLPGIMATVDELGRRGFTGTADIASSDGFRIAAFQARIHADGGVPVPPRDSMEALARCVHAIVVLMGDPDSKGELGLRADKADARDIGARFRRLASNLPSGWHPRIISVVSPWEVGGGLIKIELCTKPRKLVFAAASRLERLTSLPASSRFGGAVGAQFDLTVATESDEERRVQCRFVYHPTLHRWALYAVSIAKPASQERLIHDITSGSRAEPEIPETIKWDMATLFPDEVLWIEGA